MQKVIFRAAGNGSLNNPFILETLAGFNIAEPFMVQIENNYEGMIRDINYFKLQSSQTVYLYANLKLSDNNYMEYDSTQALYKTLMISDKNHVQDGPFILTQYNGIYYFSKMQIFEEGAGSGSSPSGDPIKYVDEVLSWTDFNMRIENTGFYVVRSMISGLLHRIVDDQPDSLSGMVYVHFIREEQVSPTEVRKHVFAYDTSGKNARGYVKLEGSNVSFVSTGEIIYTPNYVLRTVPIVVVEDNGLVLTIGNAVNETLNLYPLYAQFEDGFIQTRDDNVIILIGE